MLRGILEVLSRQESLSMSQLAAEVGYSPRELASALEQMEHMGYVRREILGPVCSSACGKGQGSHCEGCGFLSPETLTCWLLTEKGQILISQKQENDV